MLRKTKDISNKCINDKMRNGGKVNSKLFSDHPFVSCEKKKEKIKFNK